MTAKRKRRIAAIVLANVAVGVLVVASLIYRGIQGLMANERLSAAAEKGDISGMKAVLAQGYSVDVDDGETDVTALISAAGAGQSESVNFLLAHGAAVNHQDYYHGGTALYFADSPAVVQTLLAHGATPNVIDKMSHGTPLLQWARDGDLKTVRLLLQHGADPTVKDQGGKSPAEVAKASGHADVAEILRAAEVAWKKTH